MNGQLDENFGASLFQVCAKSFLVKHRHHFNNTRSSGTFLPRQVTDDSARGRVRSGRLQYPSD